MLVAFLSSWIPTQIASAQSIDVGRGPIPLHVPPSYNPGTPAPLVMLLHGYTSSGAIQESYMQFTPLADEFGFLFIAPDGFVDCVSERFWNGTDACCHFCGGAIDDVGYLSAMIDEIKIQYNVDDLRVFLIGHSNGGFMSYRMACERADIIAAIASLAGATYFDPNDCAPSEPLHVLQIHGTADAIILFGGGDILSVPYPGAIQTAETWATYNGCTLTADTSQPGLDLSAALPGDDSTVTRYVDGCSDGGSAELWAIQGGSHVPALSADFSRNVVLHLLSHPKPGLPPIPPIQVPASTTRTLILLAACLMTVGTTLVAIGHRDQERKPPSSY